MRDRYFFLKPINKTKLRHRPQIATHLDNRISESVKNLLNIMLKLALISILKTNEEFRAATFSPAKR